MAKEAYLLDTSIASVASYEGHRLHKEVRVWLDELEDDAVFISAISLAECEYGLKLTNLGSNRNLDIRKAMAMYIALPVNHHTAPIYGKIRATLFNLHAPRDRRNRIASRYVEDLREPTSGKELGIQENDLWIVSVAVQYNLVFVTSDGGGGMRNVVRCAAYDHRTQFWE